MSKLTNYEMYLLPWEETKYTLWQYGRRYLKPFDDNVIYMCAVELRNGRWEYYVSSNHYGDRGWEQTLEEAMKAKDELLIKAGYILLTREEADRLSVLL